MKTVIVIGLMVSLAGCGDDPAPNPVGNAANLALHLPVDLPNEMGQLAVNSWPKIRQACPGIDKHAADLNFDRIQPGFRLSIVLKVADNPISIPGHWVANGHACYFDIAADGKSVYVPKQPCQAVCLDAESNKDGQLVLPL